MTITLVCPKSDPAPWVTALKGLDSSLDIRVWPHDQPKEDIELALTWAHVPGSLAEYPNLKCISSMGAGIDHMLNDDMLPSNVPVVRLVDRELVRDMSEYLLLAVLHHFRQFDIYHLRKQEKSWAPLSPIAKQKMSVGIMGMGQLGKAAALKLKQAGFPVHGWRYSREIVEGIETFHGPDGLDKFLAKTQVLICLLPLTEKTRHILNLRTFAKLPRGACLINVGRGGHLKEPDLIAALDQGMISRACLDVFETEPLPRNHPFWSRPEILITPHISSQTNTLSVAPQILDNLDRARQGRPLLNQVNMKKQY